MKRLLLLGAATTLFLSGAEVYQDCTIFPVSQPEEVLFAETCIMPSMGVDGLDGIQGDQGIPGKDGLDGEDGTDGIDGTPGVDGSDGAVGADGADGQDGTSGTDGADGEDGAPGSDGTDGDDGSDGVDFDSTTYYNSLKEVQDYTLDSAAGNNAMSAIDFGTTKAKRTEVGVGIGYTSSNFGSSTAGALGAKYGFTDETAGIVKGWTATNSNYGVGAAVTYSF